MGESEIVLLIIGVALGLAAVFVFLLKVMSAGKIEDEIRVNRIARLFLVVCVFVVVVVFQQYTTKGTVFKLPDDNDYMEQYKDKMIKYTENKYEQKISIPSPLYDDEGSTEINYLAEAITSNKFYYLADAVTSTGDHFTISYYKKISILYLIIHFRNEVTIRDDYAKLLYDPEIRERTEEIMDQFLEKDEYTYDISYAMTDKTYTDMDQIDDYLADTGTYIDADITISDVDAEQVTKKIYQLANMLKDHNMHFSFKLHYNGKEVIGDDSKGSPFLSYDELYHRIS